MQAKPYFDGIKIGDKFYTGMMEWTVGGIWDIPSGTLMFNGVRGITSSPFFDIDGNLLGHPSSGQMAFWQPVEIVPPPRPKRKIIKYLRILQVTNGLNTNRKHWIIVTENDGFSEKLFDGEMEARGKGFEYISVPVEVEE